MHIPIIGNGDVTTPQIAKEKFDRYGVDAVMVGRASFGCPWIFKEMKHYLLTGELLPPLTIHEKMEALRRQMLESVARLDEHIVRKTVDYIYPFLVDIIGRCDHICIHRLVKIVDLFPVESEYLGRAVYHRSADIQHPLICERLDYHFISDTVPIPLGNAYCKFPCHISSSFITIPRPGLHTGTEPTYKSTKVFRIFQYDGRHPDCAHAVISSRGISM